MKTFLDGVWKWCTTEGVKVIIAIIILIISFALINFFNGRIRKLCAKRKFDKTLSKTLTYVFKHVLRILVLLALLGYLGFDTSGVAALLATGGLSVGLALQGSLSNIAGGFLLMILRPIRIDDYIEACGVSGTVDDIHLIYTYIKTVDNTVIAIPNGNLANSTITNYSKTENRRLDMNFSISYNEDFARAQKAVLEVLNEHPLIIKQPAPVCRMSSHGESSIGIVSKAWVKSDNYWNVQYDLLEQIKVKFDELKIEIPFNQLDVHMKNEETKTVDKTN